MRMQARWGMAVFGLAAWAVSLGLTEAATADVILIDNFSTTTITQPFPTFSNSSTGPFTFTGTAIANDTGLSGALGDSRLTGAVLGIGGAAGSSVNFNLQVTIDNGTNAYQFVETFTSTGNVAAAQQLGLGYGQGNVNAAASADSTAPSASATVQYTPSTTFLADFLGNAGIEVDVASLNAAAVGSVFTLGLADTAGHLAAESIVITSAGPQALLFPFSGLIPASSSSPDPFNVVGVPGPVDLSSISTVVLVITPTLNANFTLSDIQTNVPEPSSLALLALAGCALAGWKRWKTRQAASV